MLTDQFTAQTAAVEAARAAMGRAARNSYMAGGVDAGLYLLLSDDGTDFTDALGDLQRVADSKDAALAANRELEARLRDTTAQVAAQQVESQRLSDLAQRSALRSRQRLDQAEAKYSEIKRRYAAELAAEQERQLQEDARAAAQAQASGCRGSRRRAGLSSTERRTAGDRQFRAVQGWAIATCSGPTDPMPTTAAV